MIRLLRSNLYRITKSVTFWIFVTLYALYPIIIALLNIDSYEQLLTSDQMLGLNYGIYWFPLQGVFIALLCSVFFSTDFHNGTLRNKIIIGQPKSKIYLANLLTMMIISVGLSIIYILIFFAVGMPILGSLTSPASTIIWTIVDGTLVLMSYSSIMILIVMSSKNAFVSFGVSLLVLIAGALISYYMDYLVSIPEVITDWYHDDLNNQIWYEMVNEYAPSKAVKTFCRFITDILPSGQSFQISSIGYTHGWINDMYVRSGTHYWQIALYSLGMIAATSSAGIAIFKKSNIK